MIFNKVVNQLNFSLTEYLSKYVISPKKMTKEDAVSLDTKNVRWENNRLNKIITFSKIKLRAKSK